MFPKTRPGQTLNFWRLICCSTLISWVSFFLHFLSFFFIFFDFLSFSFIFFHFLSFSFIFFHFLLIFSHFLSFSFIFFHFLSFFLIFFHFLSFSFIFFHFLFIFIFISFFIFFFFFFFFVRVLKIWCFFGPQLSSRFLLTKLLCKKTMFGLRVEAWEPLSGCPFSYVLLTCTRSMFVFFVCVMGYLQYNPQSTRRRIQTCYCVARMLGSLPFSCTHCPVACC